MDVFKILVLFWFGIFCSGYGKILQGNRCKMQPHLTLKESVSHSVVEDANFIDILKTSLDLHRNIQHVDGKYFSENKLLCSTVKVCLTYGRNPHITTLDTIIKPPHPIILDIYLIIQSDKSFCLLYGLRHEAASCEKQLQNLAKIKNLNFAFPQYQFNSNFTFNPLGLSESNTYVLMYNTVEFQFIRNDCFL